MIFGPLKSDLSILGADEWLLQCDVAPKPKSQPKNVVAVVQAILVLHNFLRKSDSISTSSDNYFPQTWLTKSQSLASLFLVNGAQCQVRFTVYLHKAAEILLELQQELEMNLKTTLFLWWVKYHGNGKF